MVVPLDPLTLAVGPQLPADTPDVPKLNVVPLSDSPVPALYVVFVQLDEIVKVPEDAVRVMLNI